MLVAELICCVTRDEGDLMLLEGLHHACEVEQRTDKSIRLCRR